jgi:hypothetical protein
MSGIVNQAKYSDAQKGLAVSETDEFMSESQES